MINGLRAAILGVMVAGLTGPGWAADSAPAPAPAPAETGGYGVNPGDVLEISVWKEEDLQKQVMVRPDGYFSFPLTGDIRAEGRTVEAVRHRVPVKVVPTPFFNPARKTATPPA